MHRFFIPPAWISKNEVEISHPVAHQIDRVLRLRAGQHVIVLDNQGSEFEVELFEVGPLARGKIIDQRAAAGEPGCKLSLYLGLTQREKFEWMLQKCTEVGACIFVPMTTSRTLVSAGHPGEIDHRGRKQERWERIVQEAAEQSGRGLIPQIRPAAGFREALLAARSENDLVLIPFEGERTHRISDVIQENFGRRKITSIALFIGPEGGFTDEEIREGVENGGLAVTLGRRILRMETAAVVAAAIALNSLGE